jgi:hypothetical protein
MPTDFRLRIVAALAAGLCIPAAAGAQPADATHIPSNNVTTVNGVKTVCTGVGKNTREDPSWKNFAVKMESAAPSGDYLGGLTLDVASNKGTPVLAVSCDSPWLLMDLPPGSYKVTAWSGHRGPKTVMVHATGKGQARYVLAFPKAAAPAS